MIRFESTDAANKVVAPHVRRGVVEYADNADRYCRRPDFTLSLTRETWTKFHLDQAAVAQLAGAGELKVSGDAAARDRVLDPVRQFRRGELAETDTIAARREETRGG